VSLDLAFNDVKPENLLLTEAGHIKVHLRIKYNSMSYGVDFIQISLSIQVLLFQNAGVTLFLAL